MIGRERILARRLQAGWRRKVGLALVLAAMLWLVGLFRFVAEIPRATPDDPGAADAIVVLTGGGGHLRAGLDLLAAGRGGKLFVSGVYRGVEVEALLRLSQQSPRELECCIVLGYSADDTRGNAGETATWMASESYRSLWLVTANYHMQRSLLEFRRAMPEARIAAYPVAPAAVILESWWLWPGTAQLIVWEYCKYLIALARGWLPG